MQLSAKNNMDAYLSLTVEKLFGPEMVKAHANLKALTDKLNALTDEQLDNAARNIRWGSYGYETLTPLKVRYLVDLDTDHLENILVTQDHIGPVYRKVIFHLLKKRLSLTYTKIV